MDIFKDDEDVPYAIVYEQKAIAEGVATAAIVAAKEQLARYYPVSRQYRSRNKILGLVQFENGGDYRNFESSDCWL